jgi:hypothetical protein
MIRAKELRERASRFLEMAIAARIKGEDVWSALLAERAGQCIAEAAALERRRASGRKVASREN